MKKETIIAIILGVIFGASVALFLILKSRRPENTKVIPVATYIQLSPQATISKSIKNQPNQALIIESPEDNIITNNSTITIKGKAMKNSLLVLQSPNGQQVKKLTEDSYSIDFSLALGENIIQVTIYPKDSSMSVQQKTLHIYRLDEK